MVMSGAWRKASAKECEGDAAKLGDLQKHLDAVAEKDCQTLLCNLP